MLVTWRPCRLSTPTRRRDGRAVDSSRLEGRAEGRVVANGRDSAAVGPGLSVVSALQRPGTNDVEAALVRAAGRAGTWRFDLSGQARSDRAA